MLSELRAQLGDDLGLDPVAIGHFGDAAVPAGQRGAVAAREAEAGPGRGENNFAGRMPLETTSKLLCLGNNLSARFDSGIDL